MKVIICGAGRVGYGIAARLSKEGEDVTLIDNQKDLIKKVTERLDVRGVVGNGAWPETLAEAGAREAEMLISVTHSDEVNIVSCQIAHSLFNVPTKIARIRAQNYLDTRYSDLFSRAHIPIDVIISPEQKVAQAILHRFRYPSAFEIKTFADDKIIVLGVKLPKSCPVLNMQLRDIQAKNPDLKVRIMGIRRKGKIFRPHAEDEMQKEDEVYFAAAENEIHHVLRILGFKAEKAKRALIVGGGNVGLTVAKALEDQGGVKIRLIEMDQKRATHAAEILERSIVIQGSGLDREILAEAGVANTDTVVSITDSDQVNVLSAVVAKSAGAKSALVLVNESEYGDLGDLIGIDRTVDPRATTVSTILQHVRKGRIKSVYSLSEGQAELIDAVALKTSRMVGVRLDQMGLPNGVTIGAIYRDGEVVLPNGDTVIEENDRVILLSLKEHVKEVEHLFRVSLEFF